MYYAVLSTKVLSFSLKNHSRKKIIRFLLKFSYTWKEKRMKWSTKETGRNEMIVYSWSPSYKAAQRLHHKRNIMYEIYYSCVRIWKFLLIIECECRKSWPESYKKNGSSYAVNYKNFDRRWVDNTLLHRINNIFSLIVNTKVSISLNWFWSWLGVGAPLCDCIFSIVSLYFIFLTFP